MKVYVTRAEVEAARYMLRHGDQRDSVRKIAEAGSTLQRWKREAGR